MNNTRDPSARGLVLCAAVLFGTTGTARALGPDVSPLGLGAARIVVGAVLLVLFVWVAARRRPRLSRGRGSRRPLLIGGAGVAAYQLCFFAAVADTGVAVGTVVALGSAPVFAGLLSRITRGARFAPRWGACTALAASGVTLLVTAGSSASVTATGVALALGAGLGYAAYTVAAKQQLDEGFAPEQAMARTFGVGALMLLPVLAATGFEAIGSTGGMLTALYLGAVPTALAYVLFARGLRKLEAAEVATLTLAEPVTAAALGTIVLGERLSAVAILGAALVVAGLAALASGPRRAPLEAAARA